MKTWSLLGAVVGACVFAAPAFADSITSRIVSWNPHTHQLTLSDRSQFNLDPKQVTLPETFTPGDTVEISYAGGEDGVSAIHSVTVTPANQAPKQ